MSKEWKCAECVKHGTDACYNGSKYEHDDCNYKLIDVDYAYEQGRKDATEELAEFVMIDFALLFTKEELIEQFNKYIKRMRCCRRCAKCEYDKSYTYPYKCTDSGKRMTEESAEDRSCERWSRK